MNKEKQMDAVDKFRNELMRTFIDLCRGNDYNKLTLLKIGDTIDRIYDKQIDDIRNDDEEGYRKQSEGEWVDQYQGMYVNQLYKCSLCGETAFHDDKRWFLTNYCPNCGAKMKGV